ncbi:MAG: malto-oligosyltrehalose synthase [Gemmatimonadales bacterium]
MADILATYRLQLHAGFPLSEARALVPYLSGLGISHIHCSPLLQARRGSPHGYDVIDPTRLNPELGTEAELAGLHEDLQAHGMGLVLDIVPNHMAASSENSAWEDVLAHGPASRYARWFDIDWRATERELRSRVLLPILGDTRSKTLERGEITLALEDGVPRVRYFEHSFPLDPVTVPAVLQAGAGECDRRLGTAYGACVTLREALATLRRLPRRGAKRASAIARRRELAPAALEQIREVARKDRDAAELLARATEAYGRGPAGPARLRRLLDAQAYRLVHWRRAAREINYRRFFDVNDLVALHMEDPEVFAQTHALVLEWRRRGWVDGFRIDHPDGLLDPLGYLERLAEAAFPGRRGPPPVYVEKILSRGEQLPSNWPVSGTTGYDFLNQAEALFISPAGYEAIEREYHRIIRRPLDFGSEARQGKRLVLESGLSAGVRRLADRLLKLAGPDRPLPAVPLHALARAIGETIVSLPVYRTYVDPRSPVPEGEDRRLLDAALADARSRGRAPAVALDLLEAALLAREGPMRAPEMEQFRLRFVQRIQQLSGPATAKGVEDTAFYAYAPLLSRNEVGGFPDAPLSPAGEEFHGANARRAASWPRTMLAASTHDTKRSADARARLDVLSEVPEEWAARVELWRRLNVAHKRSVRGHRVPDPNTVYHLVQAMVAIWPLEPLGVGDLDRLRERLAGYALKAVREAKQRTSWTEPDSEFEAALQDDIEALLSPERSPRFLDDLERLVRQIGPAGLWKALARTVLLLTAPGIPDIYQGDELWSFSLVDPDNRRPVDFQRRRLLLEEVQRRFGAGGEERREFLAEMTGHPEDGRVKLHVTRAVLHVRRQQSELFRSGSYQPLRAEGSATGQVVAFARETPSAVAVVVAPTLLGAPTAMGDGHPTDPALWGGTEVLLPAGWCRRWTCALSGETVQAGPSGGLRVADLFGILPVAVLLPDPTQ